jgi:Cupin domain.
MNVFRLDDMVKGWFVGDFEPTAIRTDVCEVSVKHYKGGDKESAHVHKVATELTIIVSGKVRMSGREFGAGDIVVVAPGEPTDFEALTDTTTTVVKLPSVKGDKYLVGQ